MSFTTLQNTVFIQDLLLEGNTRGWSVSGGDAIHESCNSGTIDLVNFPIVPGIEYRFSYLIKSISGGMVQPSLGGSAGVAETTTGYKLVDLTAITNAPLKFFSNANCVISVFDITQINAPVDITNENTISWSEKSNKWPSFRGYNPDCGFSLFTGMFTYKDGVLWSHTDVVNRNKFYGVQYKTIIKFVANALEGVPKTFESVTFDANELMITTTGGITTSLGQVSELSNGNFLQSALDDGITHVDIYDSEGIYSASFVRAQPDMVNGDVLKGTYIIIELISTTNGPFKLKNVTVNSVQSKIGVR